MKAIASIAVGLIVFGVGVARAEQWTAKATVVNGQCGDRVVVVVNEEGQNMNLKFSLNGKPTADVNLKLAADGSGKTTYSGMTDPVTSLEMPAGKGKRQFKTGMTTKGVCQWVWN